MDSSPHCLNAVMLDTSLDVLRELQFVLLRVALLQLLHVIRNVAAEDIFAQNSGVILLLLAIESRESASVVRHLKATISSTLHGTEDARTR